MSMLIEEYIRSLYMILGTGNIEDESYNNALSIQHTIKKLYERKYISFFDLQVLDAMARGYGYSDVAKLLNADRKRITASFRKSCNKISYFLGDDFTDQGFIQKYKKNRGSNEGTVLHNLS